MTFSLVTICIYSSYTYCGMLYVYTTFEGEDFHTKFDILLRLSV